MQSLGMVRFILPLCSGLFAVLVAVANWWGRIMDFLNFSEDLDTMTTTVQGIEKDWGLWIFIIALVSFITLTSIAIHGRRAEISLKCRKPINYAYDWLSQNRFYEDEINEEEDIAHSLEQAALDEEITIWGVEPYPSPFEEEDPVWQKISPSYWVKHQISRDRLCRRASKYPDEGHVSCRRSSGAPDTDEQIYWYLRVNMNEIKARWKLPTKRKWL